MNSELVFAYKKKERENFAFPLLFLNSSLFLYGIRI
jgi:hypothetical protein